jgi:glycoprotein 6-alpha-L-fucosyltransferase
MGWHLFVLVGDSNRNQATLDRKERHVELLKSQNQRLKEMVSDLQTRINNLENYASVKEKKFKDTMKRMENSKVKRVTDQELRSENSLTSNLQSESSSCVPSLDSAKTRRRTEYVVKELWYYLSAEITKINKDARVNVKSNLNRMLSNFELLHHHLTNDLEKRKIFENIESWQRKEHEELSQLVQSRFHQLQNPKDCSATKKLICQINKGCGYGCQAHHVMYCFIVAYGLQRTMIIDSSGWRYSSRGWEGVFEPLSKTCVSYSGSVENWGGDASSNQNVLLPIVDSLYPRPPYMPLSVPEDISNRLSKLHGHPFVWWIGQFAKYLFRFAPQVQKEINAKKSKLGFKHPIVG